MILIASLTASNRAIGSAENSGPLGCPGHLADVSGAAWIFVAIGTCQP